MINPDNKYYLELSKTDYEKAIFIKNGFKEIEKDFIKEHLKKIYGEKISIELNPEKAIICSVIYENKKGKSGKSVEIIEIHSGKDEWHYIKCIMMSGFSLDHIVMKYFKCDQLEGIKKCLDSIIKENILDMYFAEYEIKENNIMENNLDYNKYFNQISGHEFYSLNYKSNPIYFSDNEIEKILSIFKNFKDYYFEINKATLNLEVIHEIVRCLFSQGAITILKSTDEWYYISVYLVGKPTYHYKCDQFEGLKKFIEWFITSILGKNKKRKNILSRIMNYKKFTEGNHSQIWQEDDKTYYYNQEKKKWKKVVNFIEKYLSEKYVEKEILIDCYVENREFVISIELKDKNISRFWFYPERSLLMWKSPWKLFDTKLNRENLPFIENDIKKFFENIKITL